MSDSYVRRQFVGHAASVPTISRHAGSVPYENTLAADIYAGTLSQGGTPGPYRSGVNGGVAPGHRATRGDDPAAPAPAGAAWLAAGAVLDAAVQHLRQVKRAVARVQRRLDTAIEPGDDAGQVRATVAPVVTGRSPNLSWECPLWRPKRQTHSSFASSRRWSVKTRLASIRPQVWCCRAMPTSMRGSSGTMEA